MPKRVAVLWTGGKDSCFVLHQMAAAGNEIQLLATFVPKNTSFLAHPLAIMKAQAEALGVSHLEIPVEEPYREGYERGLRALQEEHRIDAVTTGDISEVDGLPNWIRECSGSMGLEVITPLWGIDRFDHMRRLIEEGYDVLFSCVKHCWLAPEWTGRSLNMKWLDELGSVRKKNGLDLCGEQGEFHTLVTLAPRFKQRIVLQRTSIESRAEFSFLRVGGVHLCIP